MDCSKLDVSAIEEHIASIFNLYNIDRRLLQYYSDAGEEDDDVPVFPTGVITQEKLAEIRRITGFTENELLSIDESVKKKYWKRYSYFELENDFFGHRLFADSTPEDFLRRIFDQKPIHRSLRYDYEAVEARMIRKLQEIDRMMMPGTWHSGAEILDLHITTENMISYPKCRDLMLAALQMVDDLKNLFFKALSVDLCEAERDQLNFLVHTLHVTDICLPDVLIDYDTIQVYKEVYRLENLSDFHSYVKIRGLSDCPVWQCIEFLEDRAVAEKYMNMIPDGKRLMREFAMAASKFNCDFVWSDAPIEDGAEDEVEYSEIVDHLDTKEEYQSFYGVRTEIWVEKTETELGLWEPYIQKLRKAASSSNLGGIRAPYREHGPFGPIVLKNGSVEDRHRLRVRAKGGLLR